MFEMNAAIKVEGLKAFSPSSTKWRNSVVNYVNTARVVLPARCKYQGNKVQTASVLKEGQKIDISAGYNGNLIPRFTGFISRINFGIPVEIECEGYSYQLRQITNFTKSYKGTTVKKILQELIRGTDIVLSNKIPDIPIDKVEFIQASGRDVLDWLKEKCLLTVYFTNQQLYVGLQQAETTAEAKFRLGWNTAEEKDLKFNTERELAEVKIVLDARKKDGTKVQATAGTGSQTKVLKTLVISKAAQQTIAEQKRKELITQGYEGTITGFLEPFISPGMTAKIRDVEYPERTGNYFCTDVEGSFSKSGGRQKISIGYQI